jgi:hypothetical protein
LKDAPPPPFEYDALYRALKWAARRSKGDTEADVVFSKK